MHIQTRVCTFKYYIHYRNIKYTYIYPKYNFTCKTRTGYYRVKPRSVLTAELEREKAKAGLM